jgi:putative ABC transport system permease protein
MTVKNPLIAFAQDKKKYALVLILSLSFTLTAILSLWNVLSYLSFFEQPYDKPENLVVIEGEFESQGNKRYRHANWQVVQQWLDQSPSTLAAHFLTLSDLIEYSDDSIDDNVVGYSTANYFQMLGATFAQGRGFDSGDERGKGSNSAVLSFEAWQKYRDTVKFEPLNVTVAGKVFRVVGVLDKDFVVPSIYVGSDFGKVEPAVWLPMDYLPPYASNLRSLSPFFVLFARDVNNVNALENQLNNISQQFYQNSAPEETDWRVNAHATSLLERVIRDSFGVLLMMLIGALLLLLMTMTNLFLLTSSKAQKEAFDFAIKVAIGANKKIVFLEILKETLILMSLATLISLVLTAVGIDLTSKLASEIVPHVDQMGLNLDTIAIAFALCLILSVILAFASYRVVLNENLKEALSTANKGASKQFSRVAEMSQLVIQLVFAAIVLSFGASIFLKSFTLLQIDRGFTTEDIFYVNLNLSGAKLRIDSNGDEVTAGGEYSQLLESLKDTLLALPGSEQVVPTMRMPLSSFSRDMVTTPDGSRLGNFTSDMVGNGYFELLGIKPLTGEKAFAQEGEAGAQVIVSKTLADEMNDQVLNSIISTRRNQDMKIIGTISDVYAADGSDEILGRFYIPLHLENWSLPNITFLVKTNGSTSFDEQHILSELKGVNKHVLIFELGELDQYIEQKSLNIKVASWVAMILCVLSLWVVFVGVFGIQSYNTDHRKPEIAVRCLVGAKRLDMLKDTLIRSLPGILLGTLLGGLFVIQFSGIRSQTLGELPLVSIQTMFFVLSVLLVAAIVACVVPVFRVIKNNLLQVLKQD